MGKVILLIPEKMKEELDHIWWTGKNSYFEDGMLNEFHYQLDDGFDRGLFSLPALITYCIERQDSYVTYRAVERLERMLQDDNKLVHALDQILKACTDRLVRMAALDQLSYCDHHLAKEIYERHKSNYK